MTHVDDAKKRLEKLLQRLEPELLLLLRSGESFKVVINSSASGGNISIEATKTVRV